jgi:hypothetical protein
MNPNSKDIKYQQQNNITINYKPNITQLEMMIYIRQQKQALKTNIANGNVKNSEKSLANTCGNI